MKNILLLALFLIASGATWANQNDNTSELSLEQELENNDDALENELEEISKNDSAANRKNKRFTFSLGVGGIYGQMASTFQAAYFLDEKNLIGLRAALSEEDYENTYKEEFEAYSIFYKKFTGNSFYISPEIYYRRHKDYERDLAGAIYSLFSTDQTTAGVALAIGNQWQWKNFTLGCDWLGAAYNVATIKAPRYGAIDRVHATLLHLYLGASF